MLNELPVAVLEDIEVILARKCRDDELDEGYIDGLYRIITNPEDPDREMALGKLCQLAKMGSKAARKKIIIFTAASWDGYCLLDDLVKDHNSPDRVAAKLVFKALVYGNRSKGK